GRYPAEACPPVRRNTYRPVNPPRRIDRRTGHRRPPPIPVACTDRPTPGDPTRPGTQHTSHPRPERADVPRRRPPPASALSVPSLRNQQEPPPPPTEPATAARAIRSAVRAFVSGVSGYTVPGTTQPNPPARTCRAPTSSGRVTPGRRRGSRSV